MSDWKNVQYKDGKYRTSDEGGGGASALTDLTDVNVLSPSDGQVLKYDSTIQKWKNADESGGGVEDVEVNGISVVNAQNVAEIKSYKEVTQAEYQALPSSKLNDGILYCIKDSAGADGYPPLIYSDEEREVGIWRDGKPLYAKTINLPKSVLTSKDINIQHGISNLDKIIDISGVMRADNQNPIVTGYQWGSDWGCSIGDITSTTFFLRMGGSRYSAVTEVSVTFLYTKTTDTPGSGTWNQQGDYAHHYSTSEKIIGTWINKPLYELSLELTNTNVNSEVNIDISSYNIDFLINSFGSYSRKTGNFYAIYPFGHYESNSHYGWFRLDNNSVSGTKNTRLTYKIIAEATDKQIIVLQYTKTTD